MASTPTRQHLVAALEALGVDPSVLECGDQLRVVVVRPGLEDARREVEAGQRDQVVMTRVDQKTATELDRWVDAGLARSRSEAAALFLREGLKLRETELAQLDRALTDYEKARTRLRTEADKILGKVARRDQKG